MRAAFMHLAYVENLFFFGMSGVDYKQLESSTILAFEQRTNLPYLIDHDAALALQAHRDKCAVILCEYLKSLRLTTLSI